MRLPQTYRALIVALVAATLAGCYPYKDYLYDLPVTERTYTGEAVAIVSRVYGIDYKIPEIRWIVQDEFIEDEDGGDLLGITYDCVSWVLWRPKVDGPNPKDSLRFGRTALAHEMAHCALWLYRGDVDGDHSDVEWWGTKDQNPWGGLVRVAMDELIDKGL